MRYILAKYLVTVSIERDETLSVDQLDNLFADCISPSGIEQFMWDWVPKGSAKELGAQIGVGVEYTA